MSDKIILKTLSDFPEVPVSEGGMLWNETGSWRFVSPHFSPRPSPCGRGCPLSNDIPEIMRKLAEGDIAGAAETLAWEDPFPSVLGRVCPGFCMDECNRGKFDERLSIREVERFLGDRWAAQGPFLAGRPATGKSIAVVGSGPAGLSAAYFLSLLGHAVTVFEREPFPGGVPRLGIPPYRLSRAALDAAVEEIRRMGAGFETGREIHRDDLGALSSAHDAVFLAPGAHVSAGLGIEGEGLPGVEPGLSFLKRVHAGTVPEMTGDYLVVGGGNTALDTARSLMRLGARPSIVYRRGPDEMPAFAEEIGESREEAVPIDFFRAPVKIGRGTGRRLLVTLISMRPGEPDGSGRPRPVPVTGSETTVEVDGVLTAVGEAVDPTLVKAAADENPADPNRIILVGGDAAGATRTVAHAAASGKRAAIRIDLMLRGRDACPADAVPESFRAHWEGRSTLQAEPVRLDELNTDYFERTAAVVPEKASPEARVHDFSEVARTYGERESIAEAGRCFVCGSCVGCEVCATFCPDFSVSVEDRTARIDYAYCKGCGICARECPRGVFVTHEGGR